MSQTGYTPISLYYTTTASAAPSAGNLTNGELAINITDGKLYYKDDGGAVQLLASKTAASYTYSGSGSVIALATTPSLTNPTVTNYTETVYAPSAGSSFTVDLANGTIQKFTTNANATVTLPSAATGKSFTVIVAYGGTHTLTWAGGATLKWSGGAAPTATSVNGKYDIFVFTCDASNTYGRSGGSNF